MKHLAITLALLLGLAHHPATAQFIEIEATDPDSAAVSVPLQQRVEFQLSKPLSPFGTEFFHKFIVAPSNAYRLIFFGNVPDENNVLRLIHITLDQEPNTDYSIIAYGLRADSVRSDGSAMARPFILNYTTADAWGNARVSGTAVLGERTPSSPHSARRQRLTDNLRAIFDRALSPASSHNPSKRGSGAASPPPSPLALASSDPSLERTVMLLLQDYNLNTSRWVVRSAILPDLTGAFSFEGVREGTYYPVAISYANEDGEVIASYGFYDPDGDFAPDTITITGDNTAVDDLTIKLYTSAPTTAATYLDFARSRAARFADDQQLVGITDVAAIMPVTSRDDGIAEAWRYTFHSPATDSVTFVDVDAINVFSFREPASAFGVVGQPVPDAFIDSDEAVRIADANGGDDFRALYASQPEPVSVEVTGGDLDEFVRPAPGVVFWKLTYRSPPFVPPNARETYFIDMATGEVLESVAVATEHDGPAPATFTLEAGYPNPFRASTDIRFTLTQPSHVRVAVYDLLGRDVATLVEGLHGAGSHTVTWNAGSLPGGTYMVRLETPDGAAVRRILHLR